MQQNTRYVFLAGAVESQLWCLYHNTLLGAFDRVLGLRATPGIDALFGAFIWELPEIAAPFTYPQILCSPDSGSRQTGTPSFVETRMRVGEDPKKTRLRFPSTAATARISGSTLSSATWSSRRPGHGPALGGYLELCYDSTYQPVETWPTLHGVLLSRLELQLWSQL